MTRWNAAGRRSVRRLLSLTTSIAKRLGPLSHTALSAIERLPGSWQASLALSRSLAKSDPQAAVRHAERVISARPYTWQGHTEKWKLLDQMGEAAAGGEARLAAVFLVSDPGLEILGTKWWGQSPETRGEVATKCDVPNDRKASVAKDIVRLGGASSAGVALKRYVQWAGAEVVPLESAVAEVITGQQAAAIATYMRKAGNVELVSEFLALFPESEVIALARRGIEQDLKVLRGEQLLTFGVSKPIGGRIGHSIYLLHNSLPHNSGGYATRSHGLLRGLAEAGRSVVAVTRPGFPPQDRVFDQDPRTPSVETVDGIDYHRIIGLVESTPRRDLQGFIELYIDGLRGTIENHRPTIIHAASNWWNGFGAVAAATEFGLKSVYEIRGLWEITRASRAEDWSRTELFRVDAAFEQQAASLADRVIVITAALKREMVTRGIPENKITVVPNAVDPQAFAPRPKDSRLAESLGVADSCVIGFAGSITFYEGLDDLFRASARIRQRSGQQFSILIVGDGPLRLELEALATNLGISDITRFVGRVPHTEVPRFLSIMDITPFPRKPLPVTELVSPLKPLESMASGVAVLASDVEALKEMVPDGTGLLHRKGDLASLTDQLEMLIEDKDLRSRLASNAREWVLTERNWTAASRSVADVYEALEGS